MATIGSDIVYAQQLLETGEVVAIPTETVYGLAGNAYDEKSVLKIFQIKQRPSFDPLIVHTSSIEQMKDFVTHFPNNALLLAKHFWPGPLTLLLKKKSIIPDLVTSGLSSIGVRIPKHSLTRQLLQQLPFPLAAPSANPFGYISPTTPKHVHDQLGNKVPYILSGGACKIGIESTIVGFKQEQPLIYRLGGTSLEAIEQVVGPVTVVEATSNPQAPGTLQSHYAPTKPLLVGKLTTLVKRFSHVPLGILAFDRYIPGIAPSHQVLLAPTGSLEEAAKHLFAALRTLDQRAIALMLATPVPDVGIGSAVNDRLKRAAMKFMSTESIELLDNRLIVPKNHDHNHSINPNNTIR